MTDATNEERHHFEKFMDMLQTFQSSVHLEEDPRPSENGVVLTLGPRLQVQIQFQLQDT
jgi:hypothetical protein